MKQALQFALWHATARAVGWLRPPPIASLATLSMGPSTPTGVSVVIPSRNGQTLLAAQLPGIMRELTQSSEAIVVDNGSDDGTVDWLAAEWPSVQVEHSPAPLSFAGAVNRGIARARHSHVCLLNNDMLLEPGFFFALLRAFDAVPGLFCATAQIRFPADVRREETGKAVMAQTHPDDFPVRCDEPLAGEDLTWVLYGSGGCSLYDAAMLRALGGVDEAYAPAYVEDLDLGYRAWRRGWPSVFVANAIVEHRHRATTSRYFTEQRLAEILEINYLRFLMRAVVHGPLFRRLWKQAIDRLRRRHDRALRHAAPLALAGWPEMLAGKLWRRHSRRHPAEMSRRTPDHAESGVNSACGVETRNVEMILGVAGTSVRASSHLDVPGISREEEFLALTGGDVAVFPGGNPAGDPLVTLADRWQTPSGALLAQHCEVILVRGGNEAARRAALQWTEKKWRTGDKWAGWKPVPGTRLP